MDLHGKSGTRGNNKRKCRKAEAILLLMSLLAVTGLFSLPAQAKQRVLKVVLTDYDDEGFVVQEADGGDLSGYYVEYLEEIAKYTGWNYEYLAVSERSELERIAVEQDFDLMIGVDYSKESEELYFEYPESAMGSRHLVLASLKSNSRLDAENSATLKGIRVGVSQTAVNVQLEEKFISYCFTNELECVKDSPTSFNRGINLISVSEQERFELLEKGELDAVITSDSMALLHNLLVVDTFGRMPFYTVAAKGETGLLKELEQALNSITGQDSQYEERLYNKYFASNLQSELSFQGEAEEFLQTEHVYRVAMWDGCAPYGYRNDDGEWSGLSVLMFDEISRMTDGKISFEYVSCEDSFQANQYISEGRVDILGYTFSMVNAAERGDKRSKRYYTDYFCLFSNMEQNRNPEKLRIAVKKDMTDGLLKSLGAPENAEIIRVENAAEALLLVDQGEADITFALRNVGDYYMNYYRLQHLQVFEASKNEISFCSVFGPGMEPVAREICNMCIAHLDGQLLDRCITETILTDHRNQGVREYIRAHWAEFVSAAAVILVFAVALLLLVVFIISGKSRKIYRMLYHDEITGGISFLKFEEEVRALTEGGSSKYYIFFGDISSFKYINDVFGYAVGDCVLEKVKELFGRLAGEYPYARMYADHFVAVHPFEEKEKLEKRLQALLQEFATGSAEQFNGFNVFLKIGIYLWDTSSQSDIRQCVNLACYAADTMSDLFRSDYCFYTMEMHDKILARQEIEKDMHRAMAAGEFVAYFQPKYDIIAGKIIGAEALVRWLHRTRGLISPGRFIPVFEKNGFILELDLCMFRQVCAFLAERIAQGKELYVISCNFSRRHFRQSDFAEQLLDVVEQYQVPACYLEIEITETVATSDFDMLIQTVKQLKEYGFKISIDDFGSGYSCIQLLYKLPLDVLKLDRVFVAMQESSQTEEDVNHSIVNICRNNDIQIICEGVETQEQKRFVESYGCRFVQGFLYSRPVDRSTFVRMLDGEA